MSTVEPHKGHKSSLPKYDGDGAGTLRERVCSLRLPQGSEHVARSRNFLPWVLCLLLAASTAALAYRASYQRGTSDTDATPPSPAASVLAAEQSAAPVASSDGIALESKGYLIPAHQILVSPKVSGMIVKLNVLEGQRVTEGDVLADIEDTDYKADHARAKAAAAAARQRLDELENGSRPEEVAQARAEMEEAKVQLVQLKAEWERGQGLVKIKALPQQDLEVSESKYFALLRRIDKLKAILDLLEKGPRIEKIEAARADLGLAEAELAKAKWRWDNTKIRAPISGTILKKNAEKGNIVNPVAFNGSFSVCDMANLADLEVDLSIQERDIALVFEGQKCRIRADAYPQREYRGYVARIMPIADRAKGSISVRVKVAIPSDEEGVYLKPEMAVLVSFFNKGAGPAAPPGRP